MLLVAGAALIGGFVRGFAGFGSALVVMPLATMVIAPQLAIIMMCFLEIPSAIWLLRKSWGLVRPREIALIMAGALIGSPIGIEILIALDPPTIRWIICGLIFMAVTSLATGWRYSGATSPIAAGAVGFTSGITGAVAAIGLVPVVLFWLSGREEAAAVTRANILAYSVFLIGFVLVMMTVRELVTVQIVLGSLAILPFYIGAAWVGERYFAGTSNQGYKSVALLICALAALIGLPLWSGD
ncbi:MAG: sulfite exporter TauE/SafE family protein [Pseudomonadota bacterium]